MGRDRFEHAHFFASWLAWLAWRGRAEARRTAVSLALAVGVCALAPRIVEAYLEEKTDRAIFEEMGALGLLGVTVDEKYGGAGAGYVSGGKTGTAQVFSLKGGDYKANRLNKNLHDHGLFIAFAPADNPKIALAVLVENAGFGAQSAAPIARMVMDYYLLGKAPDGPAKDDDVPEEEE